MLIWEMSVHNGATQVTPEMHWSIDEPQTFDGRPKLQEWETLNLIRPRGYMSKKLTDIIQFGPGSQFVLSERAVSGLYDLLKDDVELLPVRIEDGEKKYWLMYVTTVLNCVDYRKSEYRSFPSGQIYMFDALWFRARKIGRHNLFKIKDAPSGYIYVSNNFKERAEAIDAIGPRFVLVWDSRLKKPIALPPFH